MIKEALLKSANSGGEGVKIDNVEKHDVEIFFMSQIVHLPLTRSSIGGWDVRCGFIGIDDGVCCVFVGHMSNMAIGFAAQPIPLMKFLELEAKMKSELIAVQENMLKTYRSLLQEASEDYDQTKRIPDWAADEIKANEFASSLQRECSIRGMPDSFLELVLSEEELVKVILEIASAIESDGRPVSDQLAGAVEVVALSWQQLSDEKKESFKALDASP